MWHTHKSNLRVSPPSDCMKVTFTSSIPQSKPQVNEARYLCRHETDIIPYIVSACLRLK